VQDQEWLRPAASQEPQPQETGAELETVGPRKKRLSAIPAAQPFHRLGRTDRWRWWRSLYEVVPFGVVAIVVMVFWWLIAEAAHKALGGQVSSDGDLVCLNVAEELADGLVSASLLLPVALLITRVVARRPAGSVLSVLNRLRWRWLLVCVLLAVASVLLSVVLVLLADAIWPAAGDAGDDGTWIGWEAFWLPATVIVLLVPVQSAAEEVVDRGWVLQLVGAYGIERPGGSRGARAWGRAVSSPWPAIVVSSAWFTAGHAYAGWDMISVLLWALAMGWLTVRTGGVEAGIALHATTNLVAFGLPVATGTTNFDTAAASASSSSDVILYLLPVVGYVLVVSRLASRRQIARLSPTRPGAAGPSRTALDDDLS
jgi:membrane protease YdiL (CAAX protease family)